MKPHIWDHTGAFSNDIHHISGGWDYKWIKLWQVKRKTNTDDYINDIWNEEDIFQREMISLHGSVIITLFGSRMWFRGPAYLWLANPSLCSEKTISMSRTVRCFVFRLHSIPIVESLNTYPLVNYHSYGKSRFLMGKSTINGHVQ